MKNVVVIAPNWLGDAVMSLPLVGYLSAHPEVRVRVVCSDAVSRVYWGIKEIDELIVLSRTGRTRRLWSRARTLGRIGGEAVAVLPPSFSSSLGVWLAGLPNRVGFRADGRGFMLNAGLSSNGLREEHLTKNYLRLGNEVMERLGCAPADNFVVPRIRVSDAERSAAQNMLRNKGVPADQYAVVVPGAIYGATKTWPGAKYSELVAKLSTEIPVVLAGTRSEEPLCARIASENENACNIVGITALGEFFALMERAAVVVANDSGGSHVAASLGVPVVAIFGSTSPQWTAPIGERVEIVRVPVHCSPCFLERCPTQLECYQGVSPNMVLERVTNLLHGQIEKVN